MKIVVLHGQSHKGSTYNISQLFLNNIKEIKPQIREFHFVENKSCLGCFKCIMEDEKLCPHYKENYNIISSIEQADIVVIESPCYCLGMTGQLKDFLDHMAYRWLPHRPHKNMFNKIGLVISTAAGSGSKKVCKDLSQHMFYWGISNIYKYPSNVHASSWENVSEHKKNKINKDIKKLSKKIINNSKNIKTSFKLKMLFSFMRVNQKNNTWNEADKMYWKKQGWI